MKNRIYFVFLFNFCFLIGAFSQQDTTASDTSETETELIPVFILNADDLENEMQSQDVSGLLQASRDVFNSVAGFNFSAARFRKRGYGSENFVVMLNGVKMNNPESRWAIWSVWGGLNDITRYQNVTNGIGSSAHNFGGVGGSSNIEMRASSLRKGTRFSYAITNRTYRNRIMLTHSTGMMSNGWAASVSLSSRWANEGYIQGTHYSAMSYFLSLEKKLNDKHSIGLVGFGAPTIQGRQGIALQEVYDLEGTNYYNPYWGYQNGEKRNARVRNNHVPMVMLSHYFTPDETTKLSTTAYYQFGRAGQTSLNWQDAKDPRPDYYRYLPSYYQSDYPNIAAEFTTAWQTDENTRQINWDNLYNANYKNLYTLEDADGISGNSITGNRGKYIVEEARTDPKRFGLNSILNKKVNDRLMVSAGINLMSHKSHNFKVAEDLLGADFWVDIDKFAEQTSEDGTEIQSDLNNPNSVIEQGESFGYDYHMNINKEEAFAQAEYKMKKIDVYAGLQVLYTTFWRTGNMKNGQFPDNSFGDSEKQNFLNYGAKAGIVYKLTGRHFLSVNGAYLTRPPSIRNTYASPRTRDHIVDGLKSEQLFSGDVNYHLRYPSLKARATWFYTQVKDQAWLRNYYHDGYNSFVNYAMQGVDYLHTGVEVGVQGTIASVFVVSGAFTKGDYVYNSRPTAAITIDNSSEVLAKDRTVYLKNYHLGGMPQTAASIGLKYNNPKYWWVGADFNYFADIYLPPAPDRRTAESVDKFVITDPQWSEVLDQQKLDNDYTLNVFAGKSFRLKSKYFLMFTLNVSNVLNNKNFITGGYEQLRTDNSDINRFPPKYGYMYGTTYFAMASLRF
ncbi:MAG: hypothetical protein COA57_16495 [Flavobacteriales bacterium]|nr:MAG: hypothetical protein COA57_16495 [Flavobacteriales bacterium]